MHFIKNLFNFGKHKEEADDREKLHPPKQTPSRPRAAAPPNPSPAPSQLHTSSNSAPSAPSTTPSAPPTAASKEKVVRKSRQREIKKGEPKETKETKEVKKEEVLPTPKTITEETKTQCENEKKSDVHLPKRPTKVMAVNSEEVPTDFETVAAPSRPAISKSATRNKKRFSTVTPASPEQKESNENEEKKERTEDTGATQEQTETTGGTSAENTKLNNSLFNPEAPTRTFLDLARRVNSENIEEMSENMLILESNDGQRFEVSRQQALQSTTISDMLLHTTQGKETTVPLSLFSGDILEKWLKQHDGDTPQSEEEIADCEIVEFFSAMNKETHMAVVRAASFLNIQRLKDNGCKLFTTMIREMTLEETRRMFDIGGPIP